MCWPSSGCSPRLNVTTVMGTAQAAGVIALAAARRGIDVHFHTPTEVKAAVTGNGAADKAQVTAMVTKILALQAKPTPADAADALGAGDLPLLESPDDRPDGGRRSAGRAAQSRLSGQSEGRPMISSVRGEVLEVALDHVVIEAAGIGYRVNATPSTLATLRQGSEVRLVTAMIVREDSMTLYGFSDADTRDLFLTLLSVSGVGPRLAMATLAVHDAAALRQALADSDVAALTRVPGIGKRGAERMVLELRDKVGIGRRVARPCAGGERQRGAQPRRGSPCRPWLCGQAGRGGHRQGPRRRSRRDEVRRAAWRPVVAGEGPMIEEDYPDREVLAR